MSEGPSVTWGCAGSGKTLDSVDQYFYITKTIEASGKGNKDDIAYITFQEKLRDNAREQIKAYEVTPRCYTLPEFFKYTSRCLLDKLESNEFTFIKWFDDYYSHDNIRKENRKSDIKYIKDKPDLPRLIFSYYRGMYKGAKELYDYNLNSAGRKGKYTLTKDEFVDLLSHEANNASKGVQYLTGEEIENIYAVCSAYHDKFCTNKYDDNDWAIEALLAIKSGKAIWTNTIIIDEVQDLTALQIRVLLRALKPGSNNIFFYGDPHQTINPTVFDDGVLGTAVNNVLHTRLKDEIQLLDMHRTNPGLRRYLADLQIKRTSWLGSYMDNVAKVRFRKEDNEGEDKRWATRLIDSELEYKVLQMAQESASAIIVPNNKTKNIIASKYPSLNKNYIFTIYEAKGIEWNKVVLYNMLSNADYYFEEMIEGRAKHSTICRTMFNKYYVGCTRARETFVVIENGLSEQIKEEILDQLPDVQNVDQLNYYFEGKATYSEWFAEAQKLINSGNDESAIFALSRARGLAMTGQEVNAVDKLFNVRNRKKNTREQNVVDATRAFFDKDYSTASLYYKAAKMYNEHNLCLLLMGQQIPKADYLKNLINSKLLDENPEAKAKLIEQKAMYELIARTYRRLKGKK